MTYDDDHFTLETSGRTFYANNGVLGLAIDGDADGWVSYGADGAVGPREEFTDAERIELADHMIAQWQRFKEPA
jgi:hypothetical protein